MYIPNNLPIEYIIPYVYIKYNTINKVTDLLNRMNLNNTKYNRKWLNTCIQNMIDEKWINGIKVKNSKYEIYDRCSLDPGTFSKYNYNDINFLMHKDGCNNLALIKYYITLIRTINYKSHVGCCSLDSLSEKSGLSKLTVMKYNKILESSEIIYFRRFKNKMLCNRYGLYDDKVFVDIMANKVLTRYRYSGIV